jgi:TrmH family RNA methyltransferase
MGAIFQLRIEMFNGINDYKEKFQRDYYTFMTDGGKRLGEIDFTTPYSFIFGNESEGLSDAFHIFGTSVRIDHNDQIDSLNIAIAVGISLYESRKNERN